MVSRINVKFIVAAGITLTALTVAGAWYAVDRIFKSAEESAQLGDEAAAQDDWETALAMYSRAVAKDQGSIEWIDKWLGAIRKTTPKTTQLYSERYYGDYMLALRARAEADRDTLEPFKRYLDEIHTRIIIFSGDLGAWEAQLSHVTDFINRYRGDEAAGRVLRRYPGLAAIHVIQSKADLNRELLAAAVADIEAAIAADPADEECVIALASVDVMLAADHRKRGETDELTARENAARKRLEDFIAAHPPATASRMALLQLKMSDFARTAPAGTTRADAFKTEHEHIQQIVDAAFGERKDKLQASTTIAVADLAETTLESGSNTADMLMTQALQGRPNDPQLLLAWGRIEMLRGKTEQAMQRLQTIIDLPIPTVSLNGIIQQAFRGRAASFQVDTLFAAWETATTPEEREKFEARVKERREALTQFVAAENTLLLSIDARTKFMEGDLVGARKLLSDYNEDTGGRDLLTVQLLAEVLIRQGNMGAARTTYERALELNPRNVRAMTRLASMAMDNREYDLAKRYLTTAASFAPRDEQVLEGLRVATELALGEDSKDPVLKLINEVRPLTTGIAPDLEAAAQKLRDGLRGTPGDARLSLMLAEVLFAKDDKPGALEAVRAGLAANADHARLKAMELALNDPDPVNSRLRAIDQAAADDLSKHIARFQVLMGAGRAEEAHAELDAAAKLSPNEPLVVELLFARAAERSDTAELDRLCALAETHNIDQARGLVFRTRRDLLVIAKLPKDDARRGRMESVAAGLRTALAQDRLNPSLWRMLGLVQLDLSQYRAAAETFSRAVQIRPNDVVNNTSLVKAYVALGEYDDALAAARKAESVCGRDPEFARLLLFLESEGPGGDRAKALELRRRLAIAHPDDMENKLSLVSLLLNGNRIDEADPLAIEIEKKDKRLGIAARCAILAKRGDATGAVALYREYLGTVTDPVQARAEYLAAAHSLSLVAGRQHAIALLEPARALQDPVQCGFDRAIGDLHFDSGEFEKATDAYRRVIASGSPDTDRTILKRLVESYLRRAQFQQAEELIASAGPAGNSDSILLILAAQAASGLNNPEGARRSLDRAVAADPENYIVYFKRAEFTGGDPARNRDTEADLEQAIKLRPDLTAARRMLATMYFASARVEQGVDQIRKALAATPQDVELRMDFVELLIALQRVPEALDLLEEPVRNNPDDLTAKLRAAQVNTRTGRFDRATQLMRDIFEMRPTSEIAELYVISLTSGPTPDVTRAMEVLRIPALQVDKSWKLIMLRARVWARAKKLDDAKRDAKLAWASVNQSSAGEVDLYFKILAAVFETPEEQVSAIDSLEGRTPFTGWPLYQASLIRQRVPALASQAELSFRRIAETPGLEPSLTAAAWSAVGGAAYRAKSYEDALKAFQRALAATPDSPELNNNLAFTLGVDLKRPAEALPYAEAAARLAPSSPMILDTLGTLYHALGRNKDALPVLERAVNMATSPSERVPALIHFATALNSADEKSRARYFANLAGQFLAANPSLKDYYETTLKDLVQTLDGQ